MRDQIAKEVDSIVPLDEKERTTIQDVLAWIGSGAELCRIQKPATPNKHLVSYFVLVDGEYVLLVDHIAAELWLPTGGHVEPEEHPQDTVIREAREELNITADFLLESPLLVSSTTTVGKTAGHTDVSLWYTLRGDRQLTLDFDKSEFNIIRWFHKDDIPLDRTDPEMGRFIKKLYCSSCF